MRANGANDVAMVLTGNGTRAPYLSACPGTKAKAIEWLVGLWKSLVVEQVFRVDTSSLLSHVAKWGGRLLSGGAEA